MTLKLFKRIVGWSGFIGIALLIASGVLHIGKRQAYQYTLNILTSFYSFSEELKQHFNQSVVEEDKIHIFSLLIILLLAIAVRLSFLSQPMRYDEAQTFTDFASKSFFEGLSHYKPNNHLFHTLLVHMAYLLIGNQPWVLRLPALFAGLLLVPASYMKTRIFYNKDAALLAAGFVASSSVLIEYSANARGYTMICVFFLLIFSIGKYLMQNNSLAAWLLFAILSALGFYTIPIMLYPFGIVVTWLLLSIILKDTKLSRLLLLRHLSISLIILGLLTFMLYLPVFIGSGLESVIGNKFIKSTTWSNFVVELPSFLRSVWREWNRDIPTVLSYLLVIGFFTSSVFHKRLTSYRVPIILAVVIWLITISIVHPVVVYE